MKKTLWKTYGRAVAYLLGLSGMVVGYNSCAKYGTPTADFIIRGKVIDSETSQPIPKIGVIRTFGFTKNHFDTVYTNMDGEYELKYEDVASSFEGKMLIATDIDGEANGLYKADTLQVKFGKKDRIKKGKGSDYEGVFEKTNQNFSLKPDKDIAE